LSGITRLHMNGDSDDASNIKPQFDIEVQLRFAKDSNESLIKQLRETKAEIVRLKKRLTEADLEMTIQQSVAAEEQTEEKNMDIVEEMAKTCETEEVATTIKKPAQKRAASGVDRKKLTQPKAFLTHEQAKAETGRIGLNLAVMDCISMEDFPRLAKIAGFDLDRFQKLVERQEKASETEEDKIDKGEEGAEEKETQEKKKAEKEKQAAKAKAPVEHEQKSTKKDQKKSGEPIASAVAAGGDAVRISCSSLKANNKRKRDAVDAPNEEKDNEGVVEEAEKSAVKKRKVVAVKNKDKRSNKGSMEVD